MKKQHHQNSSLSCTKKSFGNHCEVTPQTLRFKHELLKLLQQELRELWIVIGAVAETLKTLFWVGVLLFFVIWVFGILVSMCLGSQESVSSFFFFFLGGGVGGSSPSIWRTGHPACFSPFILKHPFWTIVWCQSPGSWFNQIWPHLESLEVVGRSTRQWIWLHSFQLVVLGVLGKCSS